jgi:molybdopterin converting factor small subunit
MPFLSNPHGAEEFLKVQVEVVGVPMLEDALGKRRLEVDLAGGSIKDLVDTLVRLGGDAVREALFTDDAAFDNAIQMVVNGERFVRLEEPGTGLNEGDTVMFMMLIGGG